MPERLMNGLLSLDFLMQKAVLSIPACREDSLQDSRWTLEKSTWQL